MFAGIIPAVIALFFTYLLAQGLSTKGDPVAKKKEEADAGTHAKLPHFLPALSGPIAAVILLSLRPLADIEIDPMLALPFGGLVGSIVMGQFRQFTKQATFGLSEMSPVAVLLIGTGSLAGIIANSALGTVLIDAVAGLGLPIYLLAPLSGIVMSGATSSTTSGAIVASSVFSGPLLASGFSPLGGATMINAGATVFDHLPHGSFFHSSGGSISIYFRDRLKLIPHETAVGIVITIVSVLMYGFFGFG